MNATLRNFLFGTMALAGVLTLMSGCASGPGAAGGDMVAGDKVVLTGANEVPPVLTTAAGSGTVTIKPDHTVTAILSLIHI